jgi:hypothetical protein
LCAFALQREEDFLDGVGHSELTEEHDLACPPQSCTALAIVQTQDPG